MQDNAEVIGAEVVKMRVVARIRPFNRREKDFALENAIEMSDNTVSITFKETQSKQFTFDSCYWSHDGFVVDENGVSVPDGPNSRYAGQEAIFKDIGLKSLEATWQGKNSAVIAYGMTGTGKSHTILGHSTDPGLVYHCCRNLFAEIDRNPQNKYKVILSLFEIYNEQVIDLLSKSTKNLQIKERRWGVEIKDLTNMTVKSARQMEELFLQGLRNRNIAATKMNSSSSRSHLIATIDFQQFITDHNGTRTKRRSHIRFVDLAGSERAKKTGATGQLLREGQSINRTLSGLGNVIRALCSQQEGKKTFVPYRDTKLTRVLKEELGGSCVTTLIASLSPSSDDSEENLSTLQFVSRAGAVNQKVRVNDLNVDVAVKKWEATIAEQEAQLSSVASEEERTELEKSIETHRQSIRQLEAPWLETESKDKNVTWWSTSVPLQQKELETSPYLQNISEDALLSGITKHIIPEGHILAGKSDSEEVKIQLSGLGILAWHAIIVNTGNTLSISPCSRRASVHVNGRRVHMPTELGHMDRIKLGACELFLVIGFPERRKAENASTANHTYEKCLTEIAEQHRLSRRLRSTPSGTARDQTAALLLFQEFVDLLPQVFQARALGDVFGKSMAIEVEAKPDDKMELKLCLRVLDRDLNMEWVWSKDEFEDRKLLMDELYERFLSTGKTPVWNKNNNPFYDGEKLDMFLGRCRISLNNIAHFLPVDDLIDIYDFRGRRNISLHVRAIPSMSAGELPQGKPCFKDPDELLGKPLYLTCALSRFSNVWWVAANPQRGVYCKVWLERQKKGLVTEKVYGMVHGKFESTYQYTFDMVTPTELNFFQTRSLVLEVWGTQTPCLVSSQTQPPLLSPQSSQQDSENAQTTSMPVSSLTEEYPLSTHEDTKDTSVGEPPSFATQSSQSTRQDSEESNEMSVGLSSSPVAQSLQSEHQDTEHIKKISVGALSSSLEQCPQSTQQASEDTKETSGGVSSLSTEQPSQSKQQASEDTNQTSVGASSLPTEKSPQIAQQASGDTNETSADASSLSVEQSPQSKHQDSEDTQETSTSVSSLPEGQALQSAHQDSQDAETSVRASSLKKEAVERFQQGSKGDKATTSVCVCM